MPVSLNYSTNGFRVQDMPGSTGLGWSTSLGGAITRFVEGKPDEEANGYCGANHIGNKNASVNRELLEKSTSGEWDTQPDKFYFSFMGFSGVFMLTPNGVPVMESSYGIKIISCPFAEGNSNPTVWHLRDQQGNSYVFGNSAKEVSSYTYHGEKENTTRSFASTWYLQSILTADGRGINFNYLIGSEISYTNYNNVRRYSSGEGNACDIGTKSNLWNENIDIKISAPLYLNDISINDGTSIKLLYGQDRQDLSNGKVLTEIQVKAKDLIISKYGLKYDYFTSGDGTNTKRLKLSFIEQEGKSQAKAELYRFFYNETVNLPARNSIQTD